MYGGETEEVTIEFDRSLIEPVFDKFGEKTLITVIDESTCSATVEVQISPTFFGWLAQFGGKMRIVKPKSLLDKYRKHIQVIA